jgi:hypothetical protein
MPEHKACNGDDDDQQRGDRENGVVGDCRAASEILMFDKAGDGVFDQNPFLAIMTSADAMRSAPFAP